ncbi:hypothetical protein DPEC_G00231000 [Dallia pectoralis]|uniref:Uncharacterized protein n=1 Tax=Dallia pectoralis TaxID=75939 RepID=A0ACC2FX78_DALPE|nr:hypothetical protein DPEC_G00231000 [Dallia pectoralis]
MAVFALHFIWTQHLNATNQTKMFNLSSNITDGANADAQDKSMELVYILLCLCGFTFAVFILLVVLMKRKHRTLIHTIEDVQSLNNLLDGGPTSSTQDSCINRADLAAREVRILQKLGAHKHILHLIDWDLTHEPYMLILESVNNGTLRSFLQVNQEQLRQDSELPHLLTTAAYHIADAMRHMCSKMVVHRDLAIRNIMVSNFPKEVKLTEFGRAKDMTSRRSCTSRKHKVDKLNIPLRWYPPEYFRNSYYSFEGDVWAFGIVLWEMQTFGSLPYPNLETPEMVVQQVCSGYRNSVPDTCSPVILQLISDCGLESYTQRPSFHDIVKVLEDTLENDADYVKCVP